MRKWNSKQKSKNTISQCIHSHEHHRGKDNPPYCCVLGQWPGKTVVNDGLHTCPLAFYVLHSFSVKYFQSSFLVTCSFWLCTFQWFTKPIMLQSVWGQYGDRESRFRNLTWAEGGARIWGKIIRGFSRLEQVSQQLYCSPDELTSIE